MAVVLILVLSLYSLFEVYSRSILKIIISSVLGLGANGIYSTVFYFAVMIELSRRVISQITTPLVSDSLENQDLATVEKIYKQTSINQTIVGGLFFIGLVCNLGNVFALMPNGGEFVAGHYVFYFIGLSKVMEMAFANSSAIISMSEYYKFNVLTIAILAALMIALNLILIPAYGISGAAFASLSALFVFGLVKMIFIRYQFGFLPFTWKNATLLLIGIAVLAIGFSVPTFNNIVIDLITRSTIIAVVYCGCVYLFEVSVEVNNGIKHAMRRFTKP